jgi:hypothetical protein
MKLQHSMLEFSALAHPVVCGIDFFQNDRIIRVKQREVIELSVALTEEDWELCFALAEGLRPVGSNVPHWLAELSEGVFSRTTALVADSIRDENGLTIGLFYAFYSEGIPPEMVLAYQRLIASQCTSLIQHWQNDQRHKQHLKRLWSSIESSCPGFLILDDKMRVVEKGSLYEKSVPQLVTGDRFEQHFVWDGMAGAEEWKTISSGKQKLRFYHTLQLNQRYKCTIQPIQSDLFLVLSNPVINSNHAMVDYQLTANDFPAHDYITDFVFLQTTTLQSLEEVQRSNELLQFRNKELELIQSELLRDKLILENKIEDRNERMLRFLNFPEQNPNPVLEIDFNRRFISFSNKAAKAEFGELLTLPYHEFLAMFSLTHELVSSSLKLRVEFDLLDRYYVVNAARVPHEDIVRLYVTDATEMRSCKNLLARQQQGLNQLLGVLEAFNIDRGEAIRRANLNEVIQEVNKLLSSRL